MLSGESRHTGSRRCIAWAATILLAAGVSTFAQDDPGESPATGEITVDIGNAYVWRGQRLSRGAVAQFVLAGEFRGFAASVWSNFDPSEYPRGSGSRRTFTETDLSLSYGRPVGRGTLTGGFVYYSLRGGRDTSELFVGYELDLPLRPSATLYVDADEGKGAFLILGADESLTFTRGVSLDLQVEVGFNLRNRVMGEDAEGRPFSAPYHAGLSGLATIPIWRGLALTAGLGFSVPLSGRASEAIASASYSENTRSAAFGSLGLTASFAPVP